MQDEGMRDRSELDRRLIWAGSESGPVDKRQINFKASPRQNHGLRLLVGRGAEGKGAHRLPTHLINKP